MWRLVQGETPRVTREYQATESSSAPLADVLAVWNKHQKQQDWQLHPSPAPATEKKEHQQESASDINLSSLGQSASVGGGTVNQDLSAAGEWWGSLAYLPLEASR